MTLASNYVANTNGPEPVRSNASTPPSAKFPDLYGPGMNVDPRAHETPGNALHRNLAYAFLTVSGVVLMVATFGTILLAMGLGWLVELFLRKRVEAQIRGTCIEVSPQQFPEIYTCAKHFARRLNLSDVPRIYIVEGNVINAAAVKLGSRKMVFLVDDIVWGALKAGTPNALSFIVAHELAHHALGHTNALQSYLSAIYPKLARLNELSCDRVALQLVMDREAAFSGLTMLTIGPQLAVYVNRQALFAQAEQVATDKWTKKAERAHTHPFLLRRLHELRLAAGR